MLSNIKVFYWHLALNSIPTASVLKGRNMSDSSECKICGVNEDTWEHALLHSTMSRCVWALMDEDVIELLSSLSVSDPKQWVSICVPIYRRKMVLESYLRVGQHGMQEGKLYMKENFKAHWQLWE